MANRRKKLAESTKSYEIIGGVVWIREDVYSIRRWALERAQDSCRSGGEALIKEAERIEKWVLGE